MEYTIKQIAEKTGISAYTLRYYEKEGLLPPIKRVRSGNRVYNQDDLDCLAAIKCLKNTGMPIREIKRFVELIALGDSTLEERRQMVLAQKQAVEGKIATLMRDMEHIDEKLACYDRVLCKAGICEKAV